MKELEQLADNLKALMQYFFDNSECISRRREDRNRQWKQYNKAICKRLKIEKYKKNKRKLN